MAHDEIKKNCISGCASEKKAETCGGKQNSKRKKTDVIDIAQQLKNEKKITSPVRKKGGRQGRLYGELYRNFVRAVLILCMK